MSICNDTQASGHASCTVNHTVNTTQCQQAHPHTLSFYIPLSAPMIHLSLCGLDMLAGRLRLKCDGTRAETSFRLSASPFKSAGGVSSVDYWQPRCAHQR
jgi:hypothetical protein